MNLLLKEEYSKLEELVYARARDLEIALFQYYLDNEDKINVVHCLTIYQNRDGGFGHGLEPDSLNPNSSGIQTNYALNILKDLGYTSKNLDEISSYVINRALHYIYRYAVDEDGYISATISSNNDYPCASWWKHKEETAKNEWGYNPSASLYAHTLWFTNSSNKYYKRALKLLPKCLDYYFNKDNIDGHELSCFINLYDVMKMKNIMPNIIDKFYEKLNKDIDRILIKDADLWGKSYSGCCYPLELLVYDYLINTEERKELVEKHLDYIIDSKETPTWDITWNWGNDYQEFELQRVKWRGIITVNNLSLLKKYNRLENSCLE